MITLAALVAVYVSLGFWVGYGLGYRHAAARPHPLDWWLEAERERLREVDRGVDARDEYEARAAAEGWGA